MAKKRRKLHEISLEEDIRYRGPLSYQGFMVLGWLCLVITTVHMLLSLGIAMNPEMAKSLEKIERPLAEMLALWYVSKGLTGNAEMIGNEAALRSVASIFGALGIGGSSSLILVVPAVLLFSYTREPKHPEMQHRGTVLLCYLRCRLLTMPMLNPVSRLIWRMESPACRSLRIYSSE